MSPLVLLLAIVWLAGISTPAARAVGRVDAVAPPAPMMFAASLAQEAYLKASNTDAADRLGYAVAIDGDTAVVTSINESSNAAGVNGNQADNSLGTSGAAYVFVRTAGGWTQQAYLKASNPDANDQFGSSVSISGNTIVIGAEAEDSSSSGVNSLQTNNSALQAGAAYVFVRSGTTWTQQAYLKPSNMNGQDHFGVSVAVSGDTIAVGAHGEDSTATGVNGDQSINTAQNAGAVYIFVRSGTTWTQQAYIKSSNTAGALTGDVFGDVFGRSVSLDGNTLVVGAANEFTAGGGEDSAATYVNGNQADDSAPQSGAAYVFVRSGTTWSQQAYLKASNTGADDRFGFSVGVSGDTIVVGAFLEDSNGVGTGSDPNTTDNSAPDSGAAYVYVRTGSTWTLQSFLKASNTGAGDRFGWSVGISGDRIVVGSPQEDSGATGVNGDQGSNATSASGAAYVFTRSGGVWTQEDYLKASNPGTTDQFGIEVAVSGDTVLASALAEDSNATGVNGDATNNAAGNAGAAYVFGPAANQAPTADAGSDQFAAATSASGASVTLTGATSSDPEGDTLTYEWRNDASTVVGTTASITPTVDFGAHTFTLTVTDPGGLTSTDTVVVTVDDAFTISIATPPIAPATYTFGQSVTASFTCSDSASILQSCVGTAANGAPINTLAVGPQLFEVTATNTRGDISSIGRTYNVVAAGSTVTISCPASAPYSGAALAPCTATVSGAGMSPIDVTASLVYSANTNAGTANVSAAWAGDAGHDGSNASASFEITKAALTVTANDKTRAALAPNPVFDGTLIGVLGADGITASYDAAAATLPGTYPIVPTLADPNGKLANYTVTSVNGTLTVVDLDPPVLIVPAPIVAEATSADGAAVTFEVTAVDAVFGGVAVTCAPASGSTFAIGETTVTCTAQDGVGNAGAASFVVTVQDTTAPALTATDITAVATSAAGIAVTYAPIGHDAVSGDVTSVCSPTSGTVFAIGEHTVSCSATDAAGNVSATATFTVRVLDGVAPTVMAPAPIVSEATSAGGATVTFSATASDNVDETLTTSCAPASGSLFGLGDTIVTCTATDAANNTGSATFTVTVRDTTAPSLSLPVVAPVVSLTPTVVVDYAVTASDTVDGAVAATCSPASGSAFPVGSTTVTCTAADAAGNSASGTFTIKVNDGVSPVVTVNPGGDRTVEATSSAGAAVTYSATATDNYDAGLTATCSPASGSIFPIGAATVVTCAATDSYGNVGTTTFIVTVVDTTAPLLTLPAPISQDATGTSAAVSYSVTAVDLVDGAITATCSPASGAMFPIGATTVHCTAADARGNSASGDFTVTVVSVESGIGRFVAFSRDNTRLRSQVTVVTGDIGANERLAVSAHRHRREGDDGDRDDVTVQIGERSTMQQATSRVVGDTVNLVSKATVYNVVDNFLINRSGRVLGTVTSPMTIPFLAMPSFPAVTAGTAKVEVAKNKTVTLAAGTYGSVHVSNGGTLILTGGLYQVFSIDVDQQGTILFRGASEVRVKTELETGSKAKIILDQSVAGLRASQVVFYVLGADSSCAHSDRDDDGDDNGPASVHIGQHNVLQANIYAANGTLWLKSKTQATGAFIAMHVRIGERVTLTLDSAFR